MGKSASQLLGAIVLLVALGMGTPAAAAEGDSTSERIRLYVGGGVGGSKLKGANSVFFGSSEADLETTALKAFIGIEFEPHSALEIAVIDFGKFEARNTAFADTEDWKAQGVNISYVGGGAINSFVSMHLKVGLIGWRVEDEGVLAGGGAAFKFKESGVDWSFGVGTQFNFGRFVAIRLEFEQFHSIGEQNVTGSSDIQMISTSLLFRL